MPHSEQWANVLTDMCLETMGVLYLGMLGEGHV